jgi:oligopeptide/dipeptide ABC transporter ATP-binding protein
MSTAELLTVRDLSLEHQGRSGPVALVEGVDLDVHAGEIVGVVGESGCGKSLTMLSILGLLPTGVHSTGDSSVRIEGTEVVGRSARDMLALRGRLVALIPSDAGASLDPVARIGAQLDRALRAQQLGRPARERRARILEMLGRVRLPEPERQMHAYPHQLSGGMQQRVAIAAALLGGPRLLIADEPTTALDVTVQAQVLRLLLDIREGTGAGILFVTHDMTAIAEICDRVVVMYAGQVVETGTVDEVVQRPRHPYTRALLASVPPLHGERPERLTAIPGTPPQPGSWPEGCRFRARCPLYEQLGQPSRCSETRPVLTEGAGVACHFAQSEEAAA